MTPDEYRFIASEVAELESLLAEIPVEDAIDRAGLESRLELAKEAIANYVEEEAPRKARLTFRGDPVFGTHGIVADFAAKAATLFTDAFSAIVAENLRYMGPIPEKDKNPLLITGTALGSFGFEFELPPPPSPPTDGQTDLFPKPYRAADAMQKLENFLSVAAAGSDDEISVIVDEIHPRAVRKVAEFLDYLSSQEAWCGLAFTEKPFQFSDVDQVRHSAARLKEDNIKEFQNTITGELQGVLPKGREFEFKPHGKDEIIKGRVGSGIEDADVLNSDFLHKLVTVTFEVIQVGQGRPRYTIQKLEDLRLGNGE